MSQPISTAQLERLAMLAEEAGEVVQCVTKIMRHGFHSYNPDLPVQQRIENWQHLMQELQELQAVASLMVAAGDLPDRVLRTPAEHVVERKRKWMKNQ